MKRFGRILGGFAVLVGVVGIGIFLVGRFTDGPLGFFSGGPFRSGDVVAPVSDWAFATDTDTIEMQLLEPPRSRTVWIVVDEGDAYVPCGVPNFRLWKQWPHEAREDGRAEIRIEGRRYPVNLVKTEGRALFERLLAKVDEKYGGVPSEGEVGEDTVWFFRLDPRPAT